MVRLAQNPAVFMDPFYVTVQNRGHVIRAGLSKSKVAYSRSSCRFLMNKWLRTHSTDKLPYVGRYFQSSEPFYYYYFLYIPCSGVTLAKHTFNLQCVFILIVWIFLFSCHPRLSWLCFNNVSRWLKQKRKGKNEYNMEKGKILKRLLAAKNHKITICYGQKLTELLLWKLYL